jgi:LPXTG-site transpeptidase (sortase) family protein
MTLLIFTGVRNVRSQPPIELRVVPPDVRHRFCTVVEISLILTGALLCGWYALAGSFGEMGRRSGIAEFTGREIPASTVLWSASRLRDYYASLPFEIEAPLAILRVPSVELEVPVYATVSELHLNRGAGVIQGMAAPGHGGNVGIAGHRDGFFRSLEGIRTGDVIELRTRLRLHRYRVSDVEVVDARDRHVLADTEDPTVTLVTCYPFYYPGPAPRRFIVRAKYEWAQTKNI